MPHLLVRSETGFHENELTELKSERPAARLENFMVKIQKNEMGHNARVKLDSLKELKELTSHTGKLPSKYSRTLFFGLSPFASYQAPADINTHYTKQSLACFHSQYPIGPSEHQSSHRAGCKNC
jgi:hypothetical protein